MVLRLKKFHALVGVLCPVLSLLLQYPVSAQNASHAARQSRQADEEKQRVEGRIGTSRGREGEEAEGPPLEQISGVSHPSSSL